MFDFIIFIIFLPGRSLFDGCVYDYLFSQYVHIQLFWDPRDLLLRLWQASRDGKQTNNIDLILNYCHVTTAIFSKNDPQIQIRSLYGPLTNLIAKKNLKLSTSIKIERLLEFINSEYAGFRCGSVFLIRTDVTMELFFSIVINTILLYQMIFFLFYVPT